MKIKTVVTVVLLVFVAASVVYLLVGELGSRSVRQPVAATDPEAALSAKGAGDWQVLVYYFHGTARCSNCIKFEAYSKEAIDESYLEALQSGHLDWVVVNVDDPENRHFIEDYRLVTRSLILVKMQDGRQVEWKNLEKIWQLVGDKAAFEQYVKGEIAVYLGEGL